VEKMKQAITIKFLGTTYTKGARLKATTRAGSVTLDFDYGAEHEQRIKAAVDAHNAKFGWTGAYSIGTLPNGCYVAVFND
jgi:hypothetical protein